MATKPHTPRRAPQRAPRKKDTRPTLVLKSVEITDEWKGLINRAASASGRTQVAFAVEELTRAAQRVLKGEPEPATGLPPAVVQDEVLTRLAGLSARLESLEAREARGWWERVFGRRS